MLESLIKFRYHPFGALMFLKFKVVINYDAKIKDGMVFGIKDLEGGEDDVFITLESIHERVKNVPLDHLLDMINGNDDATTGDVVLQTVLYNEIIFG